MNSSTYYEQSSLWDDAQVDSSSVEMRDKVIGLLPAGAQSILDAGCGNGFITNILPSDRRVVGCDISEEALKHVRRETRISSLHDLPFEDEEFDLVLATDVLEHLPDAMYGKALDELFRVSSRWLLVAVPYDEILDVATVECSGCGHCYHVHWHQRAFSAASVARLWEGRAGVAAHAFCGRRWVFSSEQVVALLHLANGRNYAFEHALCPRCGTAHRPSPARMDGAIERLFEAMHYGLAIEGRIKWPKRSEIVVLFDKQLSSRAPMLAEEDASAPPHEPQQALAVAALPVLVDPDAYGRDVRVISEPSGSTVFLLPRLPRRFRVTPNADAAAYDFLSQESIALRWDDDGWATLPALAPAKFGFAVRVHSPLHDIKQVELEGEGDAVWRRLAKPSASIGAQEVMRVESLSELANLLEEKRARAETRTGELLETNESLETARAAGERRIHELLALTQRLETCRASHEEQIFRLEQQVGSYEARQQSDGARIADLLALSEDLEARRSDYELRIAQLMQENRTLEEKRSNAEEKYLKALSERDRSS